MSPTSWKSGSAPALAMASCCKRLTFLAAWRISCGSLFPNCKSANCSGATMKARRCETTWGWYGRRHNPHRSASANAFCSSSLQLTRHRGLHMDSALSNFKHRLMDVGNGVKLNTITGGSGQPLFLLHGFPQTWQEWKPVMPELAKKYTVVAVDLKGCGQSDKPVGGYDKVTMAGELDQLREKLGFGSVYVVGHDIGGMVAYAWAATRRPSVSKIAILDITIPGVSFWDQLFVDSRAWHYGFFMKRDLPEKLLAGQEFAFIDHFIRDRVYNQGAFSDSDIQIFANGFAKPGAMRGCLEWYRAFEK